MTCVGCKSRGKPKTEEPCCRCDTERERAGRLLDDPVLKDINDVIMRLADDWRKEEVEKAIDWKRGQVVGAIKTWHRLALKDGDSAMVDAAYNEYMAMVGY